jgi:hypothetical protein
MTRLLISMTAVASLAGCNFFFDPDKVPRPGSPYTAGCTPTGCAGHACGYVDCGVACAAGSGCSVTHAVTGTVTGGAGNMKTTSQHKVTSGRVETTWSAGAPSAPGGHSVTDGSFR